MPKTSSTKYGRRRFLRTLAATGAAGLLWPVLGVAGTRSAIVRKIPSGGEAIPVIGLGSWITFNVGNDPAARDSCAEVMRRFFSAG